MTRVKENGMLIDKMTELAKSNPTGTYEKMVLFQLGTIASMLADISKSLAILADMAESEDNKKDEEDPEDE